MRGISIPGADLTFDPQGKWRHRALGPAYRAPPFGPPDTPLGRIVARAACAVAAAVPFNTGAPGEG